MPRNTSENTEAVLIRRAGQGDVEAFDRLVMRHRQSILHFAWTLVRDWDLAEDLAQQTLLEAYRGLSGLREPQRFRAWLLTIARRRAMRYFGSLNSQPATIEFSESVIYPLTYAPPPDEMGDRIRESLLELSARNRQVVVLHYLDGYSCSEISACLSIPAGTVKRILHESRNHLRTGMGVAAKHPGGGTRKMEAKRKPGPRYLAWWINGQWPGHVLGDLLSRAACLATNKEPKTIEQLSKELDANAAYIEQALQPAINEGLMSRTDDGKYLTNFIALDAEDWISMTQGIRELAAEAADFVTPLISTLEEAWNRTTLPERGFPWLWGIWPTLALMVCNNGVGGHSGPHPEAPQHASGNRYWAGAHESVGEEHQLWTVGFSLTYPQERMIGYGFLWSYGLRRNDPHGPGFEWHEWAQVLTPIAYGITDPEAIASKACMPVEKVREVLAKIIETGMAERRDGVPVLTFPVLNLADGEILKPAVDAVASKLVTEMLNPMTADLADKLRAAGYGHLEEQFDPWRGWWRSYISGEAMRELLNRKVLPEPGDPAPTNFALVGWEEGFPLL